MKIENFEHVLGKKHFATYDVYIEKQKLTIRNFKVIRSKKGSLFGVRPSYCKEVDGENQFFPLFSFSPEFDKEFDKQMQEALQPYISHLATCI